jgi:effector-binding domain-containing protein
VKYTIDVLETQSTVMAVARDTLSSDQISGRILQLFDLVYAFLKTAEVKSVGLNVAVYLNDRIDLEVGVPVTAPFEDTSSVFCSSSPAGRSAHTVHYGPYSQLGEAHRAVQKWCQGQGLITTGVSWEVYGHWNDDTSRLRTDVYHMLTNAKSDGSR